MQFDNNNKKTTKTIHRFFKKKIGKWKFYTWT